MANAVMYYNGIGKEVLDDGSTYYTVYGNMMGQTDPNVSSISYTRLRMSEETSYDLLGFQPGHTVLGYVATVASNQDSGSYNVTAYLQYNDNGTWRSTGIYTPRSGTTTTYQVRKFFWQIGIKNNEIWTTFGNQYRLYTTWKVGSYTGTDVIRNFTVSNMYFDDTIYPDPGVLTVDGANLVYTDIYGAKHIIAYDGNYSGGRPGTNYSGYLWLDPNVARRLYYVDEYGYVRRTYEASNRRDYTSGQGRNVGSSYRGSVWTGSSSDNSAARYLCFVNNTGYMMRLMNGNPNGTE